MKIKELRKAGEEIGRAGMSKLAIEFINQFDGSYKGAMQLAGKLAVIAKMARCDDYWHEKVIIGERYAEFKCELILDNNPYIEYLKEE